MDSATIAQDLYALLDPSHKLNTESTQDEIRKAYHKQARRLHPDKNPNDRHANEKFDAVQKAYELLSDAPRRAEYDRRYREKQAVAEQRQTREINEDSAIRAMRESLEKREQAHVQASKQATHHREARYQADRRRTENENVMESIRKQQASPSPYQSINRQPFSKPFSQSTNPSTISLYLSPSDTEASLNTFFSQFGSIELILMKTKKAYITYFDPDAAQRAINQANNQSNQQANRSNNQAKFDHWKVQLVGQASDSQSTSQPTNQSTSQSMMTSYEALCEYETSTFARLEEAIRNGSSGRPNEPIVV